MRKLDNYFRVQRLILDAIRRLDLNLDGINVLTEAASGPFIVTPLIAAMAGAPRVFAVCRDSTYGSVHDIENYLNELCRFMKLDPKTIELVTGDYTDYAAQSHVLTNLGFVRPITEKIINALPDDAAIPLMWETWELRKADIDFDACRQRDIPVMGTRETAESLQIFRYVGLIPIKLLLENDIEICKSNILVLSSGKFGQEICLALQKNGAIVTFIDSSTKDGLTEDDRRNICWDQLDAIIIAEHHSERVVLGSGGLIEPNILVSKPLVIHICGIVEYERLDDYGLVKIPSRRVNFGYMTVTTDYVGPRPVIELHTAGLKVGAALVIGKRLFGNSRLAAEYALKNSPAMTLE